MRLPLHWNRLMRYNETIQLIFNNKSSMKKLLFAFFAMAAIVGCSKDEAGPELNKADGNASFLKVNLKSAGSMTKAPGTFEYGTADENAVNSVTFYFFDENGDPYAVQDQKNYIYGDGKDLGWYTPQGTTAQSIEKISGLVLVIKQVQKDKQGVADIPAQMVALLNVPNNFNKTMSLNDLNEKVLNSLTTEVNSDVASTKYFIMSNSVFAKDGKVVNTASITADNLFDANIEPGEPGYNPPGTILQEGQGGVPANITPVKIYVERVAAKVRVQGATEEVSLTKIPVMSEDGKTQLTDSEDNLVYAKVLGWDVTNNTDEANLLKSIDPTWTEETLGFKWNNDSFFRSYWANTTDEPLHNLTFNDLKVGENENLPVFNYYFENTAEARTSNGVDVDANNGYGTPNTSANQAPQLLVAAQLVKDDGTPISLGRWYGKNYTEAGVKAAMVATVDHRLYVEDTKNSTDEKIAFRAITAEDVAFEQELQTAAEKRYNVFMTAKAGVTYYDANGKNVTSVVAEGENAVTEKETAKYILENVDPAQIWKNGYAYYYVTIKHFGAENTRGEYGLVRNHLYDIKISSVNGFGTPVFEPGYVITPEKPVDGTATNLSAEINILSWHLVEQEVIL